MTRKPITVAMSALLMLALTGPSIAADVTDAATTAVKQQATEAVKGSAGTLLPKTGAVTGVTPLPTVDPAKAAMDAVKVPATDAVKVPAMNPTKAATDAIPGTAKQQATDMAKDKATDAVKGAVIK